jgi:glycosyltransferase involved in cell wall biosynthesis
MSLATLVIPCFNEAERLPADRFTASVEAIPDLDFVFVNDGSTDQTLDRLRALERAAPTRITVLDRQPNRGKAEAVREGMLCALDRGVAFAGYWDADLSTPLAEVARFRRVLDERPRCQVVFGARVQLLGRSIRRSAARHYLGRIFATLASETLGLPIYDTQCGAKLFRGGAQTRALFEEPFLTRWLFDVELVARLLLAARRDARDAALEAIYELPLETWHDAGHSSVRALDFLRSPADLLRIRRRYPRG